VQNVTPGNHTYYVVVNSEVAPATSNDAVINVVPYLVATVSTATSYYLGTDGKLHKLADDSDAGFGINDPSIDAINGPDKAGIGATETWDEINKYTIQIKNEDGNAWVPTSDVHVTLGGQDIVLVASGANVTFDIYTVVNVTGPTATTPTLNNAHIYAAPTANANLEVWANATNKLGTYDDSTKAVVDAIIWTMPTTQNGTNYQLEIVRNASDYSVLNTTYRDMTPPPATGTSTPDGSGTSDKVVYNADGTTTTMDSTTAPITTPSPIVVVVVALATIIAGLLIFLKRR
jgi:hypothetical protein